MLVRMIAGAGLLGGGVAAFVFCSEEPKESKSYTTWTTDLQRSTHWDSNWDRRDPHFCARPPEDSSPAEQIRYDDEVMKAKPKRDRYLYLIRHGQFNVKGTTDQERALTDLGRKQADLTGQRLKQTGIPFTRMVHSTMTRAIETAEIIHKHLEPLAMESCELIIEGAPVPPEPPFRSTTWNPKAKNFFVEGARIEAGFRKYFHRALPTQQEDSHEIIVCHTNVIRYWVCRALQLPPEAWLRLSLPHCSTSVVKITPLGDVSLQALGCVGHMPMEMITK
ncbi:hypothetical protein HPB49_019949 [Dermacentor silvarum]|uniref:Uncharacterized protein n=1 Tax=Dermacentor silvarum TaxID=543639 RepID=A0ACB8D7F9_DERSI|nr:serine/threonine-protein phosphatase Pgam5, mitochondrial [Dermacentor silvarum]KAH7960450.1 hypothetical protein HPB49_019949 [Dermacentor silvarum]